MIGFSNNLHLTSVQSVVVKRVAVLGCSVVVMCSQYWLGVDVWLSQSLVLNGGYISMAGASSLSDSIGVVGASSSSSYFKSCTIVIIEETEKQCLFKLLLISYRNIYNYT